MLFSLLKHHLDLNITDTALKVVSRSLYCFTTSISHGVENYFPRLWGTGISDAILHNCAISIDSYSSVYKLYNFIIFSLLINAVILLLNCHVLIFCLNVYIIFFLLKVIFSTSTLFGPLYN